MAPLQLPESLQKSYLESDSYPQNLALRSINTYPTALKGYKTRLDSISADLFVESDSQVDVSFRDLDATLEDGSRKTVEKLNILSEDKLIQFMGIHTAEQTNFQKKTVTARRKDPKCRFM